MRNTNPGARLLRHKPLFIGAYSRKVNTDVAKLKHLEKMLHNDSIDTDMFVMFAHEIPVNTKAIQKVLIKNSTNFITIDEVIF